MPGAGRLLPGIIEQLPWAILGDDMQLAWEISATFFANPWGDSQSRFGVLAEYWRSSAAFDSQFLSVFLKKREERENQASNQPGEADRQADKLAGRQQESEGPWQGGTPHPAPRARLPASGPHALHTGNVSPRLFLCPAIFRSRSLSLSS